MFYEPTKRNHGLPHDPLVAIVTPRPIGWISTINSQGRVNLAPYSFFNLVSGKLPVVMFSSENSAKDKDSINNVRQHPEFVCNLATWDLREAMNQTSPPFPPEVDEMNVAKLMAAPCNMIKVPRVAEAPCALECKLLKIIKLDALDGTPVPVTLVFGQIVGIHIEDRFIKDGRLDTAAMKPLARCGYNEYAVVDEVFRMERPVYPATGNPY
jgi:flavin reductase (DIM6/NTAB) family NADH-FMN oxidoreductase RutF